MKRSTTLIALATVALIGTASLAANAHPPFWGYGQGGNQAQQGQGYKVAMFQNRGTQLQAIEQDLKLTAEQQPLWDAYVAKIDNVRQERAEFRETLDRAALRAMSPDERQEHRQAMMAAHAEDRDEIDAARKALFDALTPEQQQKAAILAATPGSGCAGQQKAGSATGVGPQAKMVQHPQHGYDRGYGPRWAH